MARRKSSRYYKTQEETDRANGPVHNPLHQGSIAKGFRWPVNDTRFAWDFSQDNLQVRD